MSRLEGLVVRRMTAAHRVADGLCERTVGGAFAPGDRLRESAIATELGIAGNTVHEAGSYLGAQRPGPLRGEPRRRDFSAAPKQLDALYARRERLEAAAVARIPTPSQVASVAKADNDWFRLQVRTTPARSWIVTWRSIQRLSPRWRARGWMPSAKIRAKHEAILDAIRFGDPGRAVAQARFHIDTNARRLREILLERN